MIEATEGLSTSASQQFELRKGTCLVSLHKPRIADDIRGKDGGQSTLLPAFGH